jgi:ubiquitin-conjugating enzyme E2 Q
MHAQDPSWLQFRFSVGAPNAEEKFQKAIEEAKQESKRAKEYPVLYVSLTEYYQLH